MGHKGIIIISWNVKGLSDAMRRRRFQQELEGMEWDILLLQETKLKGFIFRSFDLMFKGFMIVHSISGEGRGVASVVVRKHVRVMRSEVDRSGRWVWCDVEVGKEAWRVVNIYAPNDPKGRVKVWKDIREVVEGHQGMMAGHFNMILRVEDRIPMKSCKLGGEEKGAWDELLAVAEFQDLGLERGGTTWSNRQSGSSAIHKSLQVAWDESNLEDIEINKSPRQKITEPKTPYHALEAEDGTISPVLDEERAYLENIAHAEAVQSALNEMAASGSGTKSLKDCWTSAEGEAEEMDCDYEGFEGFERRLSFIEQRKLHYDEYHKAKMLCNAETCVEKEVEVGEGIHGITNDVAASGHQETPSHFQRKMDENSVCE